MDFGLRKLLTFLGIFEVCLMLHFLRKAVKKYSPDIGF